MKLQKIDHIGIVVNDLAVTTAFFLDFGLELKGEAKMQSQLLDDLLRMHNAKTEFVQLGLPDGGVSLEIIKFVAPTDGTSIEPAAVHDLGIRHIAFLVDDLEAVIARLKEKGYEVFSEIQNYENVYKICYARGPEGIILDLNEKIG